LALLFIESKRNKNELSAAAAASLQMHIMRVLVELAQFMSHRKKEYFLSLEGGLEPPTLWLTATRSGQLSYSS
jgi:hypothetical protein